MVAERVGTVTPLRRLRRVGWGVLAVICLVLVPALGDAASWRVRSSKHFRVLYQENTAFAAAVVERAEYEYAQITYDLGLQHVVKRDHVPWLWDNRCRIYLYPNRQAYLDATGAPTWSGGFVRYRERVIYSFISSSFLESTLPHELAHILFREFVGFRNPHVPRWLDEGVAQYAEVGKRAAGLRLMSQWLAQDTYIPFGDLHGLAVRRAHGGMAHLFYTQAVTVVHFLLETYGSRRFILFCSNLRDGRTIDRALSFATGGRLRSLEALEAAWYAYVLRRTDG